jgi:A/G-specific adenine glycosylase
MSSVSAADLLSPGSIAAIRSKLRTWSRKHQRKLPWRDEADPYKVWISEIMLQQTTVTAVIPYFDRFISRFPTVESLANAAESDVLKAWEGLGYYSRARNLHRAAKQIVADHAGEMPRTVEALQELPGIGRYTSGAIASFAFELPAPILEANTLRLYSRLAGFAGDPYCSQ